MAEFILDPADYKMKDNPKGCDAEKKIKNQYIPNLSDDQLRKLSREKLSQALQAIDPTNQPALTQKLSAEVLDRLDGKPGQSVTLDANIRTVTVNAIIRFADQPIVIEHEPSAGNAIEHIEDKG